MNPNEEHIIGGSLNSTTLADTPAAILTPPKPATEAIGLSAAIQSQTDNFVKNLERQAKQAEQATSGSMTKYLEGLASQQGLASLTSEAYDGAGVNARESELQDINNQIIAEQVSLQRRLEALDKNPTGMLRGALEDEKARITTESVRKQADLSVIQMARQGRFDSAKAIADRAIAAQLEVQQNKLEALRITYERNQHIFDKREQRAFEAVQAEREDAVAFRREQLQQISDLSLNALQNGAPSAVAAQMRQARTVEEAMQIGGQYVGLLDRQQAALQMANTRSLIADRSRRAVKDDEDIFTDTQLNRGAALSGMTIDEFRSMEPDVQNYYISTTKDQLAAMQEAFTNVQNGDEDANDVKVEIDNSNLPQPVKEHLKAQVDAIAPKEEESTGGFWNRIKKFFTG